jgi:hypothetical protein
MSQITVATERSSIIIDEFSFSKLVVAGGKSSAACVGPMFVVAAHIFNHVTAGRASVCSFVNNVLIMLV